MGAATDTALRTTVAEATGKPREIPPNAAAKADVDHVKRRIESLGLGWHDAIEKADLSRITGYRLLKGEASVASLRTLDEWVVREESRQSRPTLGTQDEAAALLEEWTRLGEELSRLDPTRFRQTLDGLRDVLESTKLTARAFSKMFRATPDHER